MDASIFAAKFQWVEDAANFDENAIASDLPTDYIRCTTLLPPFFFRNSRFYCKKLVIHL